MKMEINIRCQCGSDLCFEETPVDGRLEFPFLCTNCGVDCTEKANDFIRRQQSGEVELRPKASQNWLKPFGQRDEESASSPISLRPPPPPMNFRSLPGQSLGEKPSVTEAGDEAALGRVTIAGTAALVVGVLGALGWFYIAKATGYEIGYVAWALGGLVGWTSRLVAPRGHAFLGFVATLAAVLAIGGGQYLVSRWQIHEAVHAYSPEAYDEILAYAKETTEAQTSEDLGERTAEFKLVRALAGKETDPIAAYQSYQIADSGFALFGLVSKDQQSNLTFDQRAELVDPESVTVPEIAKFDAEVAPALQKLVAGQPSREEYQTSLEGRIYSRVSASTVAAFAVNRYTILWLFLGVGTAYRLARNPGLQY
jgi:hypothetical protein